MMNNLHKPIQEGHYQPHTCKLLKPNFLPDFCPLIDPLQSLSHWNYLIMVKPAPRISVVLVSSDQTEQNQKPQPKSWFRFDCASAYEFNNSQLWTCVERAAAVTNTVWASFFFSRSWEVWIS